jgi:hypothetical protein
MLASRTVESWGENRRKGEKKELPGFEYDSTPQG